MGTARRPPPRPARRWRRSSASPCAASRPSAMTSSPVRISASSAASRSIATRPKRRASAARSASSASIASARGASPSVSTRTGRLNSGALMALEALRRAGLQRRRRERLARTARSRAGDRARTASVEGGASRKMLRPPRPRAPLAGQRAREGAEPAAERAHHLADMLADDIVADADLAQAPVHVVDEQLGEQHRRLARRPRLRPRAAAGPARASPRSCRSGRRSCRAPALAIPGGIARRRRRARRRAARARARSASRRTCATGRTSGFFQIGRVLAPFGDVHIGRASQVRRPGARLAGRFRRFSNMIFRRRTPRRLGRLPAARCSPPAARRSATIRAMSSTRPWSPRSSPASTIANSVPNTLGRPTFIGQFDQRDWYYVSRDTRQLAFNMPRPTTQTVLHVRFDEAGNVASVERSGLEQVASIDPISDKTPTLGRERSLFEELFGNIGAVGQAGQRRPDRRTTPELEARLHESDPKLNRLATASSRLPIDGRLSATIPPGGEHGERHQVRGGRGHRRDLDRLLHADQHRPDHRVAAQLAAAAWPRCWRSAGPA